MFPMQVLVLSRPYSLNSALPAGVSLRMWTRAHVEINAPEVIIMNSVGCLDHKKKGACQQIDDYWRGKLRK